VSQLYVFMRARVHLFPLTSVVTPSSPDHAGWITTKVRSFAWIDLSS
jgi:hypothetical protein